MTAPYHEETDTPLLREINRIAAEYLKQLERERQITDILHGLEQFEDCRRSTKGKP